MSPTRKIILASSSPRRRELLSGLDVPFTVDTLNSFEEGPLDFDDPAEVPLALAQGKSHGFHRPLQEDEILIAADTVVILRPDSSGGKARVLGKPRDREDAVRMLRELSGKVHEVVTAVVLRDPSREQSFSEKTLVSFRNLSDAEIDYYVDRYKPYDKAGSYGVQEWIGYVAIDRIEGSFYNVMGFPVHKVYELLSSWE
ncbi:MAG: Maf family nucleotide pyrophosphatase [Bacteroidales bacterium]|nr:Maf family nucleotide pyrophosphatase [Bacteroidales bacterium]